jgi:diketogulonate reductase-like aldo/keto reductase
MHTRREAIRLLAVAGGAALMGASEQPAGIHTRPIPRSGESLPVIGLGTWQTFDVSPSTAVEEVLATFGRRGGKLVDTSPMYGRSEGVVGDLSEGLGLRSSLFIATKVWTTGEESGRAQMEGSLRALRTSRVDLMQVHNLVDVATHLPVLRDRKRAGRTRYIGITHYEESAYAEVERVLRRERVDFLQINYSLSEQAAATRLLPLTCELGVAVIANRPFAGGDLFRSVRNKPLPPWSAEFDCQSWAQFFLKWIVSDSRITCAIPATSKVSYLEDNMRAGFGRLPNEAMRRRMSQVLS